MSAGMIASTVGSVAVPIIFGLIGEARAKGDREEADRLYQQAVDQYGPEATAQLAAVQFEKLGPSAMGQIQGDSQMDQYAREALRRLSVDASTRGLTDEERAVQAEAQNEAAQYERGQRGAIEQNAQARGIGGSGFELASKLSAEQGGAERASRAAMQASAQAEARRRMAQGQLLQGATGYQGQLFGQASDKARADDAVSKFNTSLANDNARWKYDQQAAIRANRAQALTGAAGRKDADANRTSQQWSGAGAGISKGFSAYGASQGGAPPATYEEWLKLQGKK